MCDNLVLDVLLAGLFAVAIRHQTRLSCRCAGKNLKLSAVLVCSYELLGSGYGVFAVMVFLAPGSTSPSVWHVRALPCFSKDGRASSVSEL